MSKAAAESVGIVSFASSPQRPHEHEQEQEQEQQWPGQERRRLRRRQLVGGRLKCRTADFVVEEVDLLGRAAGDPSLTTQHGDLTPSGTPLPAPQEPSQPSQPQELSSHSRSRDGASKSWDSEALPPLLSLKAACGMCTLLIDGKAANIDGDGDQEELWADPAEEARQLLL